MSKLGVHALVWVGGWSEAESEKAVRSTAELGYDFIEIPLLNPYGFPVELTRRQLEQHGIGGTASLGLSAATDISSEDPETVRRGEDLLGTAVSVVRDLGASHFCGVIHSALQKYMAPGPSAGSPTSSRCWAGSRTRPKPRASPSASRSSTDTRPTSSTPRPRSSP